VNNGCGVRVLERGIAVLESGISIPVRLASIPVRLYRIHCTNPSVPFSSILTPDIFSTILFTLIRILDICLMVPFMVVSIPETGDCIPDTIHYTGARSGFYAENINKLT
jgi:hypothetical protein